MYSVSNVYQNAAVASARECRARVTIDGKVITDDGDLRKITYDRGDGKKLVGSITSQKAAIELIDRDGQYADISGDVLVEIGLTLPDGTVEYVPMPPLYVDHVDTDKAAKTATVTAYDKIQNTGTIKIKALSNITYPITIKAYLEAVCALCGLQHDGGDFLGSDRQLTEPPNFSGEETCRQVLGQIAEAALCNGQLDREGKLSLIPVWTQVPESGETARTEKIAGRTIETGTGDKGPDNPYTLAGVAPVKTMICGKNLIGLESPCQIAGSVVGAGSATVERYNNGVTLTMPSASSATWAAERLWWPIAAGTYTLRLKIETDDPDFTPALGVYTKKTLTDTAAALTTVTASGSKTITVGASGYIGLYLHLTMDAGNTGARTVRYYDIQLEPGNTATAYEPYTGATVTLPTLEPLYGDGTVSDEYDTATGIETRRWKRVELDGTENWQLDGTSDSSKYRMTLVLPDILNSPDNSTPPHLCCTHYPTSTPNLTYRLNQGITVSISSGGKRMMIYDDTYNIADNTNWKAYLAAQKAAGTPVTVVYQLAEPVVTQHPGPHMRVMDEGVMFDVGIAEEHGPINRLVLSREPQGDIVYREDADSVAARGPSELVISNNGILDYGAEDKRLAVIEDLWNAIKGCCLRSHRIKWRGDPAADTGDILCVKAKGKVYRSVVAGESLIYNGGISSTITLDLPGQTEATNTKGGLTIGEAVKRTEINVNKVSGEITSLAQRVDTVQASVSAAQSKADEAATAAAAAQSAAEDADAKAAAAAADLTTAKQNLAAVTGRVDATEEEVAAAQAAVAAAQAAADKANADAASAQAAADAAKQAADAAQADVNALAVRVTTAETSITQNSEQILLRATKTEVTTAINDIEIGGRNLLLNTDTLSKWFRGAGSLRVDEEGDVVADYPGADAIRWFDLNCMVGDLVRDVNMLYGHTITFSFWVKVEDGDNWGTVGDGAGFYISISACAGSDSLTRTKYRLLEHRWRSLESGKWTRLVYTIAVEDESFFDSGSGDVGAFFVQVQAKTTIPYSVKKLKLEYGNKPTDWTPAPEDGDTSALGIGGRNLYLGTKTFDNTRTDEYTWESHSLWTVADETYEDFIVLKKSTNWGGFYQIKTFKKDEIYTLSFYAKVDSGGTIYRIFRDMSDPSNDLANMRVLAQSHGSSQALVSETQDGTAWTRYWITVQATADIEQVSLRIENVINGKVLYLCGFKLEKGNRATDWTPAPEDTENEIAEAIDKQTRNISSQIQQTADQITQTVSETYATKDSVQETVSASTELLSDSFTVRLEKLQEKTDANTASAEETREQFETLSQYMRYGDGVLELGDSSSPILLQHKNDRIQFVLSDGTVQSLWTPTTWELTNLLRFRLGPGVLVVQPNGSISGIKAVD